MLGVWNMDGRSCYRAFDKSYRQAKFRVSGRTRLIGSCPVRLPIGRSVHGGILATDTEKKHKVQNISMTEIFGNND
jgi:hypothetical protein